jgi:hypothetical protein
MAAAESGSRFLLARSRLAALAGEQAELSLWETRKRLEPFSGKRTGDVGSDLCRACGTGGALMLTRSMVRSKSAFHRGVDPKCE